MRAVRRRTRTTSLPSQPTAAFKVHRFEWNNQLPLFINNAKETRPGAGAESERAEKEQSARLCQEAFSATKEPLLRSSGTLSVPENSCPFTRIILVKWFIVNVDSVQLLRY